MNEQQCIMAREALAVHGRCSVIVHGNSMRPFIKSGDRVTIVPFDGTVRRGMVVALFAGNQLIVHRVTGIHSKKGELILSIAGDSSPGSASRLGTADLFGIVEQVNRDGRDISCWLFFPWRLLACHAGYLLRFLVFMKRNLLVRFRRRDNSL